MACYGSCNWFRIDIHDRNRRKVVPNASSTIDAMQVFTKTDFYTDFKANAANYPFDMVDHLTRSSNSGTAATPPADTYAFVSVL